MILDNSVVANCIEDSCKVYAYRLFWWYLLVESCGYVYWSAVEVQKWFSNQVEIRGDQVLEVGGR